MYFLKKYLISLLLISFIFVGLFFRLYKFSEFYIFEHDQDLFAWIAKDIVINHHLRLIGQETSIDGLFIGPFFYYFIAGLFALFKMNPLSASVFVAFIFISTAISIYYVFYRFFGKKAGLTGSFIYTVSLGIVFYDRWVVPTLPTILWSIWFLYMCLSLLNGKIKTLPILTILIGLIWHIYVALLPLIIIPFTILAIKKDLLKKIFEDKKNIILSLLLLLFIISPFLLFELRHGFSQTGGLLQSLTEVRGDIQGIARLIKSIDALSRSWTGIFFVQGIFLLTFIVAILFPLIILIVFALLIFKKLIDKNQATVLGLWIIIVPLAQFFSKRPISEYYFVNQFVPVILILTLGCINILSGKLRFLLIPLGAIFLTLNLYFLLNKPQMGGAYFYRNQAVDYLKGDSQKRGYKCVGINYIAERGTDVGFRYLFWKHNIEVINPANNVPIYNIVIPWQRSEKEVVTRFGMLGIIPPRADAVVDPKQCANPDLQLLEPLGFTK